MPHIYADSSRINQASDDYNTMANAMDASIDKLKLIGLSLKVHSGGCEDAAKRVSDAAKDSEKNIARWLKLSNFLALAAQLYNTAENRLANEDKARKYTKDERNRGLFASYYDGNNYVNEMDAGDAFLMLFFKQFGITKEQILKLINGKGYQYKAYQDIIGDTIEEICGNADYSEAYQRYKDAFDRLKNGEDFLEVFDPETWDSIKDLLKEMGIDIGDANCFIGCSEDAIETLAHFFGDYSKNLDIIKSLKQLDAYGGNPVASKVIDDMIVSYQNKIAGALNETMDNLESTGYDVAVGILSDASPVGAAVAAVDKTISVIGKVTGAGSYVDTLADYCNTTTLRSDAHAAYYNAYEKLSSGDYTAQDVTNFENAFAYNKQLAVHQYELQLELYQAQNDGGQFNAQIAETQNSLNQLNNMSVDDPSTWVQEGDVTMNSASGGGGSRSFGGGSSMGSR